MTTRKDFIVGAAVAASVAPMAAAAAAPEAQKASLASLYRFDRARFEATLAKPARHRQCFGATSIEGGLVLSMMLNSINTYANDLGEGPMALHAAGVLYHGLGIVLAMDDATWNRYVWPSNKLTQAILGSEVWSRPHTGNPFYPTLASITKEHGASYFVCNNALQGAAFTLGAELKRETNATYKDLLAGIVPEAQVVPAGVMAINACQERHFTYLQTTL